MSAIDRDLVEYRQKVFVIENPPTFEPVLFDQLDPVLVKKRKTVRIVHQVGRALAWRKYFKPPGQVTAGTLLEAPKIERDRTSPLLYETTWEYVFAVADDAELTAAMIINWQGYPEVIEYEP